MGADSCSASERLGLALAVILDQANIVRQNNAADPEFHFL